MSRLAELRERLGSLDEQIADACASAGRDRAEVTLIAVTKTWPVDDIRLLHSLGVRDFGENRVAESAAKAASLADLELTWHFVGQLQTNKAAAVARSADVVHSVDRERLAASLSKGAEAAGRVLTCLIQVSLDPAGTDGRGGVQADRVLELASVIAGLPHLRLGGLMAVAPLGADPAEAFRRLAEVRLRLLAEHPEAAAMSAGMSGDLREAVAAGATHLRIGSALLGNR